MAKSSKKAKPSKKPAKAGSKSSKTAKKVSKPAKKVAAKKPVAKKPAKPVAKKVAKPASRKPAPKAKVLAKPVQKKVVARPTPHITRVAAASTTAKREEPKVASKPAVHSMVVSNNGIRKANKNTVLKSRYSDKELEEFRQLIMEKLDAAKNELKYLQDQISHKGENNVGDTENTFASSDDGSNSMEREYLTQMAARQRLYIDHLDKALIRIHNKTYGICRVTGKLIEKERLRAVPHATLSMEAKLMQSHPQQSQNV
jgi:RNA polymerase-binding transcription factor DksA